MIYKLNMIILIVVNAANTEKDLEGWRATGRNKRSNDVSEQYAPVGAATPYRHPAKLADIPLEQLRFFRFIDEVNIAGYPV